MTSLESRQTYRQGFSKAYCSRDAHGDLDVLLAGDAKAGASGTMLRQIMHIHVMWLPSHGVKADQPAATNSTIRWYVFTDQPNPGAAPAGSSGMIEYVGTGMVTAAPDGNITELTIQNAALHPTVTRGNLTDPIGATRFQGTLVAHQDAERVGELLSQARTTLAAANLSPAAEARAGREPVAP